MATDTGWSDWREIDLKDVDREYKEGVETRALYAAPQPAQPVGINGLTEAETNASMSVMGLSKRSQPVAQPLTWQPIETAPKDGTKVLVYRPLAHLTNDDVVSIKHSIAHSRPCWNQTIPKGMEPKNFTDGACYPTHWIPLPAAPSHGIGAKE